ncbi:MAG: adenylosuccinate lyase [Fidelibacterota bacterium]
MIQRYTTPEMSHLWSDENKYSVWKDVELAVVATLTARGDIPKKSAAIIEEKAEFSVERINEIENTTRHDVIAFLTCMAEFIGPDSRYVHMGMTSSDLLDTSLAIICRNAGEIILNKLEIFRNVLRNQARRYRETFQIGRSHGIHAEPITFGLKLALWSEEVSRHIERWKDAIHTISVGKISGAVGTYQHIDPEVEVETCHRLGLEPASISNQIIQRDRHAHYLSILALIGASLEKFSIEIRHMQRTEVREAEEFFHKGQKGSSAMPHKRNPITTEQISGMARVLRANAHAAMENVALWHERDISHSSVERIILPDSTTLIDYMLNKMISLMENLLVYPENMMKNIELTKGLIFSQEVLLALVKAGVTREDAYVIVQRNAMDVWNKNQDFKKLLKSDKDVIKYLSGEEIDFLFNLRPIMKNINKIFDRIGLL